MGDPIKSIQIKKVKFYVYYIHMRMHVHNFVTFAYFTLLQVLANTCMTTKVTINLSLHIY